MRYVPPVLMRYRYPILVLLSLLLIVDVVVTSIDTVPIEYKKVFAWIFFFTASAWIGMAGMLGVGAPVGEYVLKRPARILILPPVLFVMFILSPVFAVILSSSLLLDELIWQPYSILFIIVWSGIVVTFGATIPDIERRSSFKETLDMQVVFRTISDVERSRKIYLRMGVFPLLMVAWIGMFWTHNLLLDRVFDFLDLLPGSDLIADLIADLIVPLGALFILLSTSLVVGAVIRRSMFGSPLLVVALVSLAISAVPLAPVIGFMMAVFLGAYGSRTDAPGEALFFIAVMPMLWSLTFCVFGTLLIGRIRRPIRNITVAGVGMLVMTQVLILYLYFAGIWIA